MTHAPPFFLTTRKHKSITCSCIICELFYASRPNRPKNIHTIRYLPASKGRISPKPLPPLALGTVRQWPPTPPGLYIPPPSLTLRKNKYTFLGSAWLALWLQRIPALLCCELEQHGFLYRLDNSRIYNVGVRCSELCPNNWHDELQRYIPIQASELLFFHGSLVKRQFRLPCATMPADGPRASLPGLATPVSA